MSSANFNIKKTSEGNPKPKLLAHTICKVRSNCDPTQATDIAQSKTTINDADIRVTKSFPSFYICMPSVQQITNSLVLTFSLHWPEGPWKWLRGSFQLSSILDHLWNACVFRLPPFGRCDLARMTCVCFGFLFKPLDIQYKSYVEKRIAEVFVQKVLSIRATRHTPDTTHATNVRSVSLHLPSRKHQPK